MTALTEFLAGDRPDDVAIFLADEHLRNPDALGDHGERVEGGYVLVLPGERGRRIFPAVSGDAPMEFAQSATKREGSVNRDLTGGRCPDTEDGRDLGDDQESGDHFVRFVLAFAQEQTDQAGGPYDAGDVIHAYAQCDCGIAYSDRWVVDE